MFALTVTLTNHMYLDALNDAYCTSQYAIGRQKRSFWANTQVFGLWCIVFNGRRQLISNYG